MARKKTFVSIDCAEFKDLLLDVFYDGVVGDGDVVDLSMKLSGKDRKDGSREIVDIGLGPLISVDITVITNT